MRCAAATSSDLGRAWDVSGVRRTLSYSYVRWRGGLWGEMPCGVGGGLWGVGGTFDRLAR